MTTELNQTKPVQPIPAAQVSGATSPTPGTEVKSTSTATPIVPRPAETDASNKPEAKPAAVDVAAAKPTLVAKVTEKVLAAAEAPEPVAAKPGPSLGDLLERFVSVEKLTDPSSNFTHRGVCGKCGWQTYQLSDSDARQLLRTHVGAHWRDVSSELAR